MLSFSESKYQHIARLLIYANIYNPFSCIVVQITEVKENIGLEMG